MLRNLICTSVLLTFVTPIVHSQASQSFVTRSGSTLQLDDKVFRSIGTNLYWLGLDENVGGVNYPTQFRITDGLETAAGLGFRIVRGHTLGVSTGNPLSFEPSFGVFNDSALLAADWAIAEATRLGLKLQIPLTDNWRYYHGGKHDFTTWVGEPDETKFFTNTAAIAAFYDYVQHRLLHVNPFTGLQAINETAIFCWESGNEFSKAPAAWTQALAEFIKKIDTNHLVMDGTNGIVDASLLSPSVDLYSQHFYPASASALVSAASRVAAQNKVFINGEFGWVGVNTTAFLDTVVATQNVTASMFWSIFPHSDSHGFVNHSDGFTVHYPPGDNAIMSNFVKTARAHAATIMGQTSPLPFPQPPAPLITSITTASAYATSLAWRGAIFAITYDVQYSRSAAGPWKDVCSACGSDLDTPISLPSQIIPVGSYLRCRGVNEDGVTGTWSTPTKV
jgi:hypothetical protein